jgi:hypothetical protein
MLLGRIGGKCSSSVILRSLLSFIGLFSSGGSGCCLFREKGDSAEKRSGK